LIRGEDAQRRPVQSNDYDCRQIFLPVMSGGRGPMALADSRFVTAGYNRALFGMRLLFI